MFKRAFLTAFVALWPEMTRWSAPGDLAPASATLLLAGPHHNGECSMARKPRDFDAELQALTERAKKLKLQKTTQLGELVQLVGADTLPFEALAGALLAALEQSKKQPEAIARWTERGQAFFQPGGKRGKTATAGDPAPGSQEHGSASPASDRAA
jgi:hypothetical protein